MSKVWSNDNQQMDVDNVWDDTELIKMYEQSIQEAIPRTTVKEHKFKGEDGKEYIWKVGSKCMAPYEDNGKVEYFPANIDWISIPGDSGAPEVGVTFLYYGNEATVEMKELWENEEAVKEAIQIEESQKKVEKKAVNAPKPHQNGPSIPLPSFAPPVPPNIIGMVPANEREALSSMLMSWYMSGYHTGYYQAITDQKNK